MNKWMPLLLVLLVSSCIAEVPMTNPGTGIATTVAPADFDWNMIKTVNLQVTGMPTEVPIFNAFKVSDKAGVVHLNRWALMSENASFSLSIPAKTDSIVVSYGSVSKKLKVVGGQMAFDYVTLFPEPDSVPSEETALNQ